jgi:23S rRNA (cytidine2498-2'-O)-methyltransferase
MNVLVTCSPESEGLLALELRRLLPDCGLRWVAEGIAHVHAEHGFEEAAREMRRSVFARHLAPAECELRTDCDSEALFEALQQACGRMEPDAPWNIHVRTAGAADCRRDLPSLAVSQATQILDPAGRSLQSPEWIISVTATEAGVYVGACRTALCLSSWLGGARRFAVDDSRISRSEFKLLEAIEVFGLSLPTEGLALDLGAAPGGWTRLLLDRGLRVIAVDPAALDRRVAARAGVTQIRMTAERYRPSAPACRVLVNDMRLRAEASVGIMASYADRLQPGGIAVMTLKLPERGVTSRAVLDLVDRCLGALGKSYTVVRARQLFHNRSEITAVMEAQA